MSELERQVRTWRESIRRAGSLTAEDIEELEAHLLDSFDELRRVGLSEEEAMLVALRRAGDPTVLAVEYGKVNPGLAWARRWYWMTAGFLAFTLALGAIRLVSHAGAWLALDTGSADAWFLIVGLCGLGGLCLGITHSAKAPGSTVARAFQSMATWIEAHPVLVAHLGFSALAALTIVDGYAKGFVWRALGRDSLFALSTMDALAATAAPIGFFLLAWLINRRDQVAET